MATFNVDALNGLCSQLISTTHDLGQALEVVSALEGLAPHTMLSSRVQVSHESGTEWASVPLPALVVLMHARNAMLQLEDVRHGLLAEITRQTELMPRPVAPAS